jgi:hypothetical protein
LDVLVPLGGVTRPGSPGPVTKNYAPAIPLLQALNRLAPQHGAVDSDRNKGDLLPRLNVSVGVRNWDQTGADLVVDGGMKVW